MQSGPYKTVITIILTLNCPHNHQHWTPQQYYGTTEKANALTCFFTECTYYLPYRTETAVLFLLRSRIETYSKPYTVCQISPISGTDKATVMATQTKKAGRRICEKRPLVFLLAQWNLLTMRPWNWLSFNHQPSNLKVPCPSRTSGSGDEGFSGSPGGEGHSRWKRQNGLIMKWIAVEMHAWQCIKYFAHDYS